jgi:hypothetical protein
MDGGQANQGKHDDVHGTGEGDWESVNDVLLSGRNAPTKGHTPTNPVEESPNGRRQDDRNHALK